MAKKEEDKTEKNATTMAYLAMLLIFLALMSLVIPYAWVFTNVEMDAQTKWCEHDLPALLEKTSEDRIGLESYGEDTFRAQANEIKSCYRIENAEYKAQVIWANFIIVSLLGAAVSGLLVFLLGALVYKIMGGED